MSRNTKQAAAFGRLLHHHPDQISPWPGEQMGDAKPSPMSAEEANVVSSLLTNGNHAPALHLKVPALAVPTPTYNDGRGSNLYIDHEVTWPQYRKLLHVLAEVGLVDRGYADLSIRQGRSLLWI